MSDNKDGGQAFPRNYAYMNPEAGRSELKSFEGMTLRDYFAAKVLPEMIHNHQVEYIMSQGRQPALGPEFFAEAAYKMADAMLAERKK